MLALRLQSLMFSARTLSKLFGAKQPSAPVAASVPAIKQLPDTSVVKDKMSRFHKRGPELEVSKILIKNGPLTSREIWRSYQLSLEEKRSKKQEYTLEFPSLSKLKETLRFMRRNGKISSNGYDKKKRMFKGWKIDEQRALKYAHPQVITELQEYKKKRDEL